MTKGKFSHYWKIHCHPTRQGDALTKSGNKRERRLSYDVSYSADGVTALPFGHFIEGITAKTLTYKDLNTNDTFTLSLNTGEKK